MSGRIEFFEFGKPTNNLEKLARDYTTKGGTPAGLGLLQQAAKLSGRPDEVGFADSVAEIRESIRRDVEIDEDEIDLLVDVATEAGEESYRDRYILLELVQAAAVGSCGLFKRNYCSGHLAVAAKEHDQFARSREAYNDAIAGLQILARFFTVDSAAVTRAEQSLRNGWNSVKARSAQPLDIFAPATPDPADEWMALLLWETERGSEAGLLQQIDPMLRLALRWEHWLDTESLPLGPQVQKMIQRCDALASAEDELLSLRCNVTIGDALAEIQEWKEAANVYEHVVARVGDFENHPVDLHARAQGAFCHLMAGESDRCGEWLRKFPRESAEALSGSVITAAAELARYLAVEQLYGRKIGRLPAQSAPERVAKLVQFVSMIVRSDPANRVEYLRTLFFSVLARDVESMSANK